jgi:energy-coupling factor transporter ATP-binding protein EcfA2
VHDAGSHLAGDPLGQTRDGVAFVFDPFDAYGAGLVTNPNVVVMGSIGSGKSAFVKMLIRRGVMRGRRVVIVDPKGEYGPLGDHFGIVIRSGGSTPAPVLSGELYEDIELILTLLAIVLERPVRDHERWVLEQRWRSAVACHSSTPLHHIVRTWGDDISAQDRRLHSALEYAVGGPLAELTYAQRDITARCVVLDLSHSWERRDAALASVLALASARRLLAHEGQGYLVLDESWAVLDNEDVARWLFGSWKLARATGTAHVLVMHRRSDAAATAEANSAHRSHVEALIRDCETAVWFRHDESDLRQLVERGHLRRREQVVVEGLRRGQALVQYGPHRSVVTVIPSQGDRALLDTDQAMRT